jgi:hypothetical protein
MTGRKLLVATVLGLGSIAISSTIDGNSASAQPTDVVAMIKFIEQKPDDMDRTEWKEKRRDVARKLGASKDKRAVPALAKLADEETFDIVGEVAIEALGQIGDASAAPTLQKIIADAGRDKRQKDLAAKSLAKLGVKPVTIPVPVKEPVKDPVKDPVADPVRDPATDSSLTKTVNPSTTLDTSGTSNFTTPLLGDAAPAAMGPEFSDDTLASSDRLTFALGTASLGYDSVRKRTSFDLDAAGSYQRRIEQEKLAYGYGGSARIIAGFLNPDGPQTSRAAVIDLQGNGELRAYVGPGLYGVGRGAIAVNTTYLAVTGTDPNDDPVRDARTTADLGVALGGGYGRILDVGSRLRVARIEDVLRSNRVLGKSIDAATAMQLQRLWWGQRHARNSHQALLATIAALRSAGVILGEPDPSTTYQILAVLRDGQLNQRTRGFDVDLTFGESYLRRPSTPTNPQVDKGRVEQLLVRARYGRQLSSQLDVEGDAWGRLRILAATNSPSPWAVGASVRAKRFTYGDFGDPIGTIDLTGTVAMSKDDRQNTNVGTSLGVELGFTYWFNQASGLRLAAQGSFDSGKLFIGAKLEGSYGFIDAAFAK